MLHHFLLSSKLYLGRAFHSQIISTVPPDVAIVRQRRHITLIKYKAQCPVSFVVELLFWYRQGYNYFWPFIRRKVLFVLFSGQSNYIHIKYCNSHTSVLYPIFSALVPFKFLMCVCVFARLSLFGRLSKCSTCTGGYSIRCPSFLGWSYCMHVPQDFSRYGALIWEPCVPPDAIIILWGLLQFGGLFDFRFSDWCATVNLPCISWSV